MMSARATGLFLVLSACSASATPASGGGALPPESATPDAGAGGGGASGSASGGDPDGAGGPASVDAEVPPAESDGGAIGPGACDAGACATVTGLVERTATKPTHGGKGSVYVAIFDGNPITSQAAAVVGRALIPDQDMTSATAQVRYRIDGVPVRAQPYQVIAFLDDANGVSAASPKPASGDLVSLDTSAGFGGVPLTAASAGDVSLDLPLNIAMP